jgi:hypothetical protein
MKKISHIGILLAVFGVTNANADYDDAKFMREVGRGLDLISAETTLPVIEQTAPGELGAEVYQFVGSVSSEDTQMFIPTDMYMRIGGGLNCPKLSWVHLPAGTRTVKIDTPSLIALSTSATDVPTSKLLYDVMIVRRVPYRN